MSEIEKMYNNANIKMCKRKQGFTLKDCTDRDCKKCGYYDMPLFTTEKQLELIKWLAKTRQVHITYLLDNWIIEGFERYGKRYDSFELALAGLFNNLWQDMTNTEKQQIKEILK